MDTKVATTQIRIQQWTEIIQDRSTSGLTVDDYCESHGLSRKQRTGIQTKADSGYNRCFPTGNK